MVKESSSIHSTHLQTATSEDAEPYVIRLQATLAWVLENRGQVLWSLFGSQQLRPLTTRLKWECTGSEGIQDPAAWMKLLLQHTPMIHTLPAGWWISSNRVCHLGSKGLKGFCFVYFYNALYGLEVRTKQFPPVTRPTAGYPVTILKLSLLLLDLALTAYLPA